MQLTHRNLWLNATVFGLHAGVNDRDVYLHTLPMFHANGWGMPYGVTGMGGQHVVLRKVDGAEILRRVEKHGVTLMCAAPAVVNAALDAAADWDGEIPGRDRVRIIVAGAPPADPDHRAGDRGAGLGVQPDLRPHRDLARSSRSTGCGPSGTTCRSTSRPSGSAAPAPPRSASASRIDGEGEVLTASNHNLDGYWEQPDETARVQEGNSFHTGDGGYLDDDGYLVISDRKKDVIISGGENVSSIEVEDALMSHPAVREVAVIGIPDDKWGELVTALVVADGDVDGRGADRALPHGARRLQVPEAGGLRRRAAAHRDRQAAEVQAARAVLEGPRAPGPLTAARAVEPVSRARVSQPSGPYADLGARPTRLTAELRRSSRAP